MGLPMQESLGHLTEFLEYDAIELRMQPLQFARKLNVCMVGSGLELSVVPLLLPSSSCFEWWFDCSHCPSSAFQLQPLVTRVQ